MVQELLCCVLNEWAVLGLWHNTQKRTLARVHKMPSCDCSPRSVTLAIHRAIISKFPPITNYIQLYGKDEEDVGTSPWSIPGFSENEHKGLTLIGWSGLPNLACWSIYGCLRYKHNTGREYTKIAKYIPKLTYRSIHKIPIIINITRQYIM